MKPSSFTQIGSEKDYVILSLVRSLPRREIERNPSRTWLNEHLGFITDEHQINVALTRAKRGLCIVGKWDILTHKFDRSVCILFVKSLISSFSFQGMLT